LKLEGFNVISIEISLKHIRVQKVRLDSL